MLDTLIELITKKIGARAGLISALAVLVNSLSDDELDEFILILKDFVKNIEEKRKISQIEELINSLSDEEKEKLRELLNNTA
jgi:succinate dehydrogenase flavin-adding protein (antitoxin of CptAB toxin-antitoxin module)